DIQALEPTLRMAVEDAVAVATNLIMWSAVPVITLFCVVAWFLPELELRTTTALADAEAGAKMESETETEAGASAGTAAGTEAHRQTRTQPGNSDS
ncbi:MAG: hypothetical protein P8P85_00865, partial [Acidimicrobiales bacterium]|nr:hypothetical protein [Acidimicrobiales bacterium]